jgi:hypothetical protein
MVFSGTPVFSTNKTDCHDITEILLKGAINTINHLPEQPSSFLLHNVFALLSGSGGSFRGDSFRGRSGRHRFLGRGQGRGHRPHPKNLTHNSHQKNM